MDRMFWKMLASGVAAGAGYYLYRSFQATSAQSSAAEGQGAAAAAASPGAFASPDLTPEAETPTTITPADPSGLTH